MENKKPSNEINTNNKESSLEKPTSQNKDSSVPPTNESSSQVRGELNSSAKAEAPPAPKKAIKPPKLEDKPFDEFISNYLIPELKKSIQEKGTSVKDIKLLEGERPVVGGNCWMVFCELSEQRKFWLCFNNEVITSDKTILLAESNSDPSIVESFLIDEKKTTLPLLISRVLQRLNGQKWIGKN